MKCAEKDCRNEVLDPEAGLWQYSTQLMFLLCGRHMALVQEIMLRARRF